MTVFTGTGSESEVLGGWPGWHILSPSLPSLSGDSTSLPRGEISKQGQWSGCPPNLQTLFVMSESEWMLLNVCLWQNKAIQPKSKYQHCELTEYL